MDWYTESMTKKDRQQLREDLDEVLFTEQNRHHFIEDMKKIFVTKDEFLTRFDALMFELKAIREEIAVFGYRQADHSDRIEVLENRIDRAKL